MDTRIVSTIPRVQKRKFCDANSGSDVEDEQSKVQKVECKDQTKKQNHSEIEKRRRDKMNTYITELSSMVPMCNAMSRKLDKLTVLRMAVQHMKTLRGSINSYAEGHYKPSFLSDEELKHLILQTAEGFLFVVSCDRGRILFVSESVSHILNYSQGDLLGQSWFDILHPKDIPKVKEQLSSSDLTSKERLVDAKAMLPLKNDVPQSQIRLCPGARRSFFCRMKCKAIASVKEEADTTTGIHKKRKSADRRYCVIHCTGYLKSWAPANLSIDEENEGDSDCNLSCLVAIGQVQQELINPALPQNGIELRHMEFTSRHAADGKFLFVDQRSTLILGYLPQELLGTSCYEYFHQDDIMTLAVSHRQVLQVTETVITQVYRFRTKEGNFTRLRSKWKNFRNPWTKEFECIVSVNTLIPVSDFGIVESTNAATEVMMNSNSSSLDTVLSFLPSTGNVGDSQRFFGSRVGAGKIGRQIAEEVMMEVQKAQSISPTCNPVVIGDLSTAFPGHSTILSLKQQDRSKPLPPTQNYNAQMDSSVENGEFHDHILQSDDNCIQYDHIDPNNPNINNSDMELMDTHVGREMLHASYHNSSNEGNDEAAMAVIMSLLEADAGLGGPVDFTGLPWPLP